MTRRSRGTRGITLIEIMISMFVLGLVITAALTLYIPSLGRFAAADTAYDAQRNALVGIRMLSADMQDTAFSLLLSNNQTASANAFYIPTPRDAGGVYHVASDDTPQWQGWIAYWLTPEIPPAVGYQLNRAFLAGDPVEGSPPPISGGGRVVAGGVKLVKIEAGSLPTPTITNPGGISVLLDNSPTGPTPGGRGKVHIVVGTERVLHDQPTTFEGDKSIDIRF